VSLSPAMEILAAGGCQRTRAAACE